MIANDRPRTRSLKTRVAAAASVAIAAAIFTGAGCGRENAVVGGECGPGYVECGLTCVDLANDRANCGGCGNVCSGEQACVNGACTGALGDGSNDGTVQDGSNDGQGPCPDGSTNRECYPGDGGDGSIDGSPDGGDGSTDGSLDGGDGSRDGGDGSTDGSVTDGTITDGTITDGTITDGTITDGTVTDGTITDGTITDGTVTDGTLPDGGVTDASNPDGAPGDGSTTDAGPIDACTPPYDNPANCGACALACPAVTPVCSLVGGSFTCIPLCTVPPATTVCSGKCVDVTRDPLNCGSCGNACQSGYCLAGVCQGKQPGNLVVIGHDFLTTTPTSQQAKLLTNSIFYYSTPSIRVLSWEGFVNPAAAANAKAILTAYAAQYSLQVTFTVSTSETDIPSGTLSRSNYDALLVYDQPNAPAGRMGAIGASWASTIAAFAQTGGTVVALDGAQGIAEMPAFETNAGMLTVTSHTPLASGSPVDIFGGSSITRGMTSVYLADTNSASFTTSDAPSNTIVYATQAEPPLGTNLVAVQKVVQ